MREGGSTVTVNSGRADVTVYGPQSLNNLIGNNEVEGAERLTFVLDRLNAYEVGEAIAELPEGATAGFNVTVPRFNQAGQAYLVDLGNGRTGAVIALARRDGYSLAFSDFAARQALASFAYPADVVDVAMSQGELSTLVAAVDAAGLVDTLRDPAASYTIFAPTNVAFNEFLAANNLTAEEALANTELLTSILTYHVLPTAVPSSDITAGEVATVNGQTVSITVTDGTVMVNDATVVQADIEAGNGVIHVINKVLTPPPACITTENDVLRIRTGPGLDRTVVGFLPANTPIAVTAQVTTADGTLWYRVNNVQAGVGAKVEEAWIVASEVTVTTDACPVPEGE